MHPHPLLNEFLQCDFGEQKYTTTYCNGSYGKAIRTIRYKLVPIGTFWYAVVPIGSQRYTAGPTGTFQWIGGLPAADKALTSNEQFL